MEQAPTPTGTVHVAARAVRAGFAAAGPTERSAYLDALRATWQQAESRFTRRLFLVVAVIGVGGLLLLDDVGEVNLLGVTLTGTSTVQLLVPVVLAYLTYEIATTVASIDLYGEAYTALYALSFPDQNRHRLGDLLTPADSLLWATPGAGWFEQHGRIADFSNGSGVFWVVRGIAGLVLGPVAVVVFAVMLVSASVTVGTVVSATVSAALLAVTVIQTIGWLRGRLVPA